MIRPDRILQTLRSHRTFVLACASAIALPVCLSINKIRQHRQAAQTAPQVEKVEGKPQILPGVATLEQDAREFSAQTTAVSGAHECFPLHVRDDQRVGILYHFCSDDALSKDGEQVKLTENFTVPTPLARRFNFWRRIYSLWSKDQYVLHVSTWPEVVLEAYDGSRLDMNLGPVAREKRIKKAAKRQRAHYKRLLAQMHKHRRTPERFSPAMKRLARIMAHIPQDDKYAAASYALRLQRGQRDFIASGLTVAPKYLNEIQQNFRDLNVPEEIALLAFVESSFNLKARSKVGASGVYQIMPATGKQYLKLHSGVDERNDPIKASRAAAKLLTLNYKLLGSWPLAITAYNHGVGGVRKAVRKMGTKDLPTIIKRYHGRAFKFASKNFFTSYLGILATLKDKERLFPDVTMPAPMSFQTVRLARATSIKSLIRKHNVSIADIRELNPDISSWTIRRRGTLPPRYTLKLPVKSAVTPEKPAHMEQVRLIPDAPQT